MYHVLKVVVHQMLVCILTVNKDAFRQEVPVMNMLMEHILETWTTLLSWE
jgi:hypothetical protein